MEEAKKESSLDITSKKKKKIVCILISAVIGMCLLIGIIFFLKYKIPSKYYGTYVRYYYEDGKETKITYKITALSIKANYEYIEDGKKKSKNESYKYSKKGNDLIIKYKDENYKNYLIIDEDCLYVNSNKDISDLKKYKLFYWNIKSDKADIYYMINKSKGLVETIENTMNNWARKIIYKTSNIKMEDDSFYIFDSDKKTDETDLNTYKVVYKAAGGELTLYYNKNNKQLERIYYSGSILTTSYSGKSEDTMSAEDIYDAKAMLLSFMYVLGNKDNIELNIDINNNKDNNKYLADSNYKLKVTEEYDSLFSNKKIDDKDNKKTTYSLVNDKYDIEYHSWISSSKYSISGIISFSIDIK